MRATIKARPHARIGGVIKAYRIRAKITQRNLGKDLDIPLSMIREYEQGRCLPSSDRLIKIVNRLDIPVDQLGLPSTRRQVHTEGTS